MRNLVAALAMVGLLMPHNASAENIIYLQCLMNQGDWQGQAINVHDYAYFMIDLDKQHIGEYNELSKEYINLCKTDDNAIKCNLNNSYFEEQIVYKGETLRDVVIYRASGIIIETHYVDGKELSQARGNCSLGKNIQNNIRKF